MRSRFTLLSLLVITSVSAAVGQAGQFRFRHIDVNRGLSHNQVTCFYKDAKGFLWIGTASGLNRFNGYTVRVFRNDSDDSTAIAHNFINRIFGLPGGRMGVLTPLGLSLYDPATETFRNNTDALYTLLNIPAGTIFNVVADETDRYWILYDSAGLAWYDPEKKTSVAIRHRPGDTTSIATDTVTSLTTDRRGRTWIVHASGVIEQIVRQGNTFTVTYRNRFLQEKNRGEPYDYRLLADRDGDLWLYMIDDAQGVYWFDPATQAFRQFTRERDGLRPPTSYRDLRPPTNYRGLRLNTNLVTAVVQDDDGMIWVGTDHGGINLIDKKKLSVRYIVHDDEEDKSLAQNSIISLYKDREGIIWAGTFKRGVSYFHKNLIRFPVFRHHPHDRFSLPFDDVNRFVEDARGNLWIGTNGGGLLYFDRQHGRFTQYRNEPGNPNSLSSDVIVSLCIDHDNILWIGTFYGGLNAFDGRTFTRYDHAPGNPRSLSDRNVWEIFEDSDNRLWVGTIGGGLDLFDRHTKTFSHFRSGDINSVGSNYISAITEDRQGNLWIGTGQGVDVLVRETGRFMHYENEKTAPGSLSNNNIFDIKQDSKGRVWVGTEDGLNLFNARTKTFRTLKDADGLPHSSVLTILEGNDHDLWLGTPNGLCNVIIRKDASFQLKNYDEADGLQGKQFNENAAFKTGRGELIFGGPNGFNLFRPAQIGENKNPPAVVLSDFQLFNRSLRPGEATAGRVILKRSIAEATAVVLPPSKNVFSLEFAALNFFHPEKNQYQYMLEGFDGSWITAGSRSRKVTYTNLDPGDYVFRVKAANNDGYWNEEGARLDITVLPPFWKTRTAFILYFLFIIGGLLLARKMIQQREQMKYAIEAERREAMRMHELDMMKIKFFTNVSHEFRTPLTLILTPLEKILGHIRDPDLQGQLSLIQRNARRLLNLVNRLLDFRKLEVQEVRFNPSEGDIIAFIKETVYSFSDLSEKKDIRLDLVTSVPSLETIFDQDKLEKILFNLLSNAFKFTPEHGAVTVDVHPEEGAPQSWLVIKVADTGIGIPPGKLEKIFDRFFQSDLPASLVNQGSGIGLSITRDFTRIHGGTITVESEPGKGSCFTVRIPLSTVVHPSPALSQQVMTADEINARTMEANADTSSPKRPVLLLVEDNEDFRFYLKDNLKLAYTVLEARNGKEGLKQALKHIPDLVVSDIMMPEMDGIELCRRIKHDQHTSHIPVILLTARAADEQKMQGYDTGANDYITKPFNFELLVARIRNLLTQREQFQQAFQKHLRIQASELKITPLDETFIQNALKCVEDNLSSPDFSVEDLGQRLGISRANLYKKILSLTGKSPLEFIRTIRMQQAAQLLEKSQLTVAEVAYQVGFNNPKYFARYFKEAFHVLPSVYASQKRKPGN